jgi:hypothetical protein
MRNIHPVSLHEQFVASGVYRVFDSQGAQVGVEHWSLHALPDGGQITRADHDGREFGRASLLAEAWSPRPLVDGGRIERLDLRVYPPQPSAFSEAKASYVLFDSYAEIGRAVDRGPRQQSELALSDGTVIDAPVLCLKGALNAQQPDPLPVVTPSLVMMPDQLLTLTIEQRPAARQLNDQRTVTVGGRAVAVTGWQITDADGTHLFGWFDRYGILVLWGGEDAAERPLAELIQYARRPEMTTS